jgi:hypothetical protein
MGVADIYKLSRLAEARSMQRAIAAQALSTCGHGKAEKILKDHFPTDSRAAIILKAAVTPTSTSDFPATDVIGAFRSLAPGSAAWKLFDHPSALKLDLRGYHQINIPHVANLPPAPVFVGEGMPGPVLTWSFVNNALGPVRKILVFAGISEELDAASPQNASAVIGRVLADATNKSVDAIAFDANPGDAIRPAGLLNGVTPINNANGTDEWRNTQDDLADLIGAIGDAGIDPTDAVFVVGPREAALIRQRSGDLDNDVLMTLGLPKGTVLCVAPAGIASGYQGPPEIETSKATLHREGTTPAEIVSTPGIVAEPSTSFFQSYLIAIKVRAEAAWCAAPGAVQFVQSVNW